MQGCASVAARAVTAARAQRIALPGQDVAAGIITELTQNILALDARLAGLDAEIAATFSQHPQAANAQSMPGFVPILGAGLSQRRAPFRSRLDFPGLRSAIDVIFEM